ncbi:MAG: NAD-dependent epimerase/dehydratase family protein [Planctomycetota bacterium]|jgi:dihydroflavonol-4-reductase
MTPLTLVTGATGLLGNNIVRHLLDGGRPARVLVRESSSRRPLEGLDVEVARGDVCDAESVRRAVEGAGCVIHSAGYVQLGRSRLDLHRAVNVEGTRNVAEAARAASVRMIHVSSVDALGVRSVEEPADEQTPVNHRVRCNYVITKREAEQVVLEEVERGLDGVIVNPGFMLGPWDWKPSSGQMLLEVARGKAILAPRGWYSVCDARDVAAATVAAVERGRTGRRYILAGFNMSYLEAWRLFAEVSGARRPWGNAPVFAMRMAGWAGDLWRLLSRKEPNVNSGAVALARLPKCFTSRRAEEELSYRTRPFRQSAQDAWDWFRENEYA